jgi:hypothetical protein
MCIVSCAFHSGCICRWSRSSSRYYLKFSPLVRKHNTSPLQADRFVHAVYSENYTTLTNPLCGQNEEFSIVKAYGTYSYHWAYWEMTGIWCKCSRLTGKGKWCASCRRNNARIVQCRCSWHSVNCVEGMPSQETQPVVSVQLHHELASGDWREGEVLFPL